MKNIYFSKWKLFGCTRFGLLGLKGNQKEKLLSHVGGYPYFETYPDLSMCFGDGTLSNMEPGWGPAR